MYRIGIIGHRPGDHRTEEKILDKKINAVLEKLLYEYGKDLILNLDGEIGIGQKTIKMVARLGIKYHLFLPHSIDIMKKSDEWYDYQKDCLADYYKKSSSLTIVSDKILKKNIVERDKLLVDNSNFIVCFWNKKKQGRTFDIIKYSLKTNKMVLNGMSNLELVLNIDTNIKKR